MNTMKYNTGDNLILRTHLAKNNNTIISVGFDLKQKTLTLSGCVSIFLLRKGFQILPMGWYQILKKSNVTSITFIRYLPF